MQQEDRVAPGELLPHQVLRADRTRLQRGRAQRREGSPHVVARPLPAQARTAALHQERVNGTGYPFGYKGEELPLGSRIMAVADVFTALTEDRPYRKGLDKKRTMEVLQSMVDDVELDERLINVVIDNFEEMNQIRASAQQEAILEYLEFKASLLRSIDPAVVDGS